MKQGRGKAGVWRIEELEEGTNGSGASLAISNPESRIQNLESRP
jgi:hypothetical protein